MDFNDSYIIWFEKNNEKVLYDNISGIVQDKVFEFIKEIEKIIESKENVIPRINNLIDNLYAMKNVKIGSLSEENETI